MKKNLSVISLIGMTGAGKTTVGQALSEKLNCDFLDLDFLICEKTKKNPTEIFSLHGERAFRKIEASELKKIFKTRAGNLILSCGGGTVLKRGSRRLLKRNSFVVWLIRPAGEIAKNEEIINRPPINGDMADYIKIFEQRKKLYAKTCEKGLKIEYSGVLEAVEKIIKYTHCLQKFY